MYRRPVERLALLKTKRVKRQDNDWCIILNRIRYVLRLTITETSCVADKRLGGVRNDNTG